MEEKEIIESLTIQNSAFTGRIGHEKLRTSQLEQQLIQQQKERKTIQFITAAKKNN